MPSGKKSEKPKVEKNSKIMILNSKMPHLPHTEYNKNFPYKYFIIFL